MYGHLMDWIIGSHLLHRKIPQPVLQVEGIVASAKEEKTTVKEDQELQKSFDRPYDVVILSHSDPTLVK